MPGVIYSVSQINEYIRNMFAQDYLLHSVRIQGEVGKCTYNASGHIYFTLKDKLSVISCVMFKGNRREGLSFDLKEGMQVVVAGSVSVYEKSGKYQIYAKQISKVGTGQLYEELEKLKKKLEEKGMFAPEYKKPLPAYVKTIGVVTSRTGDAIWDIIKNAKKRNPYVQIILYEAVVQGEQAAPSLIRGIRALEKLPVDVMIVGRGGGSVEELWAFNDENLAEAVFDCPVPVISAVGHEKNVSVINYVADFNVSTPTAAAVLATNDICQLTNDLTESRIRIGTAMERKFRQERLLLENRRIRLQKVSPENRLNSCRFEMIQAEEHLKNAMENLLAGYRKQTADSLKRLEKVSPEDRLKTCRFTVMQEKEQLKAAMRNLIADCRKQTAVYIERLKGLSPLDKLNQGFSYVSDSSGRTVTDVDFVSPGDELAVYVKNGKILTSVLNTVKEERNR